MESEGDKAGARTDVHFAPDPEWGWLELVTAIATRFGVPEILVKALLEMNRVETTNNSSSSSAEPVSDRSFILDLEQEIVGFIQAPNVDSWKMVPLNSYYRLLTHKISEYYQLGHILSNDGFSMVLYKKNTSLVNAEDSVKRNAQMDTHGKVKPLSTTELTFDPEEKLNRVSLREIYNAFHEDVERLAREDSSEPQAQTQAQTQTQTQTQRKPNYGGKKHRFNNNGNGKYHNNSKKYYQPHAGAYYYPPPPPMDPSVLGPPIVPPGQAPPSAGAPVYYVPYYDPYVMFPPPPPELAEQLKRRQHQSPPQQQQPAEQQQGEQQEPNKDDDSRGLIKDPEV